MFTGMLLSAACATGPEAGRSGAPVVPSDNTPTQQGPPPNIRIPRGVRVPGLQTIDVLFDYVVFGMLLSSSRIIVGLCPRAFSFSISQ